MMTGTVFVATCDLAAQVRGRAAPVSRLEQTLRGGVDGLDEVRLIIGPAE